MTVAGTKKLLSSVSAGSLNYDRKVRCKMKHSSVIYNRKIFIVQATTAYSRVKQVLYSGQLWVYSQTLE
jgi:hypothetical protein